ncbi:hypothetical protein L1887_12849 [Cichorium endivia]|nr:hypothetical protein L1887_12849 [Cichorium endivia]
MEVLNNQMLIAIRSQKQLVTQQITSSLVFNMINLKKMDSSRLKIGLDKITSVPLNQIGETIGNALEILKNLSIKLKN